MSRVLIYGGRGGLGSVLVAHFKSQGWWVCSIDLKANDEASASVVVDPTLDWCSQEQAVRSGVSQQLQEDKVDAVINMAGKYCPSITVPSLACSHWDILSGGWAGGHAGSTDFLKNADLMWKQSVWSSGISASLAAHHLKEGGVVVLPGAKPAMGGTPGLIFIVCVLVKLPMK